MQLLFDFLPIIAFFVAYKLADIYVATMVIIAATVLQVSIHWLRTRRVNPLHLVSAGFVLVFGSLTLLIHSTAFIMWKPTVVNWLFAVAFLTSLLAARQRPSADPAHDERRVQRPPSQPAFTGAGSTGRGFAFSSDGRSKPGRIQPFR